uniref:cDNA FLJ42075 fis, clone SYNOV2017055 n=1 Tax=Homo sapiens TaxID=9606 RepID=Q6ZVU5_HUMAN|nr:unnamed protein product [Homo sapiens]
MSMMSSRKTMKATIPPMMACPAHLRIFLEEDAVAPSTTRRQHWKQTQSNRTPSAWLLSTKQRGDQQDTNHKGTRTFSHCQSSSDWSGEIWGQRPELSALSLLLASYNSLVVLRQLPHAEVCPWSGNHPSRHSDPKNSDLLSLGGLALIPSTVLMSVSSKGASDVSPTMHFPYSEKR